MTAFSLLLPVYGRDSPAHLARAFDSAVLEQTRPPDEVVVVRDGPVPPALADGLTAARDRCPVPFVLVELPENRGLAAALDRGLAACTHEIVARMDADDVAVPTRFEKQLAAMERGLDLVGSALVEFADDEEVILGRRTPPIGPEAIARYARFHQPFNHPTVVYRRSVVQGVGGYVPVGRMEDYWLFARMLAAGARADNLPEALVKYRIGSGAYRRRGGPRQLASELALQWRLVRSGFTSPPQFVRNVVLRGGYRLLPEAVRRGSYRRLVQRGFRDPAPAPPREAREGDRS